MRLGAASTSRPRRAKSTSGLLGIDTDRPAWKLAKGRSRSEDPARDEFRHVLFPTASVWIGWNTGRTACSRADRTAGADPYRNGGTLCRNLAAGGNDGRLIRLKQGRARRPHHQIG